MSRAEGADFYSDWLRASQRNALDVERSPILARGRDLTWIETPNEQRTAMLIGSHMGFPTNGTNLCVAAIPAGRHGGRHRHGEEAIHVLRGTGFVVITGRRYDVRAGTTVFVPYMDDHQLFNTGDVELEYVSASTMDLDLFVKLGRLEQLEDKGPNAAGIEAAPPAEDGQFDALGRGIALHIENPLDEADRQRAAKASAEHDRHGGHAVFGYSQAIPAGASYRSPETIPLKGRIHPRERVARRESIRDLGPSDRSDGSTVDPLEPGRAADLMVVDRDPLQSSIDALVDHPVRATMIDGRFVDGADGVDS